MIFDASKVKGLTKFEILKRSIIEKSESDTWAEAVKEWIIVRYEHIEDDHTCECTQEGLRHIFTIKNIKTGIEIPIIGSVCIKHFQRQELNNVMAKVNIVKRLSYRKVKKGELKGLMFSTVRMNHYEFIHELRGKDKLSSNLAALLRYDDLRRELDQEGVQMV